MLGVEPALKLVWSLTLSLLIENVPLVPWGYPNQRALRKGFRNSVKLHFSCFQHSDLPVWNMDFKLDYNVEFQELESNLLHYNRFSFVTSLGQCLYFKYTLLLRFNLFKKHFIIGLLKAWWNLLIYGTTLSVQNINKENKVPFPRKFYLFFQILGYSSDYFLTRPYKDSSDGSMTSWWFKKKKKSTNT